LDITGRDAFAAGGFAPAPGEVPAKVDLEAQSDRERADPNRQTFAASPEKSGLESEKSATKGEESRLVDSTSKIQE